MNTPTPPLPQSKTGLIIVISLLAVLIILVGIVLFKVYAGVPTDIPDMREYTIDTQDHDTTDADPDTTPLMMETTPNDDLHGVLVEQSTRNGNWHVHVQYPSSILAEHAPAFSLEYPPSAPWGLMRVEHLDATATDAPGPGADRFITPYLSIFTLRASNYYASANEGMTFDISVALKDKYYEDLSKPGNVYALNDDLFLGEDGNWVYLYRYKNDDLQVRAAVDELLLSFIPLHLDNK